MVVLAVTWMARSGHEDEVARIFGKLQTASRQEPGCLMYIGHQSAEDSTTLTVYEQYKDQAALETHWNSPYFKEYVANKMNKHVVNRERILCAPIS